VIQVVKICPTPIIEQSYITNSSSNFNPTGTEVESKSRPRQAAQAVSDSLTSLFGVDIATGEGEEKDFINSKASEILSTGCYLRTP
jgi:hypothetical protein